ncbi:MAG: DNA helicase RecQ [Candidatus Cloacimonetes bacterium]|nr:DNA helicase RecQ [Candidatus Cloacimonadota bacterium]
MTALDTLKKYFGYSAFLVGQEELINAILNRNDVLGVMPTGSGKSICFQVPGLMLQGITLIISPLISLMKDQVNALTQAGIPAAYINSSLSLSQIDIVLQRAKNNAYKLIYVAPERLQMDGFLRFAKSAQISLLAVDEAHCISQWGHDFRPSYARIPEFIYQLSNRPILTAFTATATDKVQRDIVNLLNLNSPFVLITSINRPNLYFEVQKPKDKYAALIHFLKDKKYQTGIVYCSTRDTVEKVCEKLVANGYKASRYHAGLSDVERHQNQDDFLYDRAQIMVATNAFGMGIDKSNVSFIIHYNMPKDMESYYQEAGRSGRDGEPANCILLFSGQDVRTNMWLIENDEQAQYPDRATEEILKERSRKRLREMTFYCETKECLREYILKYFGEIMQDRCENCANCGDATPMIEATIDAQKILSCVYRMKERFGITIIIETLRGSKSEKILKLGLDKLSTYGICEKSESELREIINQLILSNYLVKTDELYPVIKLGKKSSDVLWNKEKVFIKLSTKTEDDKIRVRSGKKSSVLRAVDQKLFDVLKKQRLKIANELKVPAFIIFPDSSLVDMCLKLPTTKEAFADVSGVGQIKIERFGEIFITIISEFLQNDEISVETPPNPKEINLSEIEISSEPTTVSIIADRINCLLMRYAYEKVSGVRINDWLISKGYLQTTTENGKKYKIPTDEGTKLGITNEKREIRGENTQIIFFDIKAQQFITQNSLEIVKNR